MNDHPTLLVRARLTPSVMEEFEAWHSSTQLPHVLAIPGIVGAHRLRAAQPIPGSHIMIYCFASEDVVQSALSSEEAQEARRDWECWTGHVQELSVEVYAPLTPLPSLHHWN